MKHYTLLCIRMNRAYRLFPAYVLLAVFLLTTAPVHLIHEFVHHHDTLESHDGALAVGVQHVHCDALQLSLPAFSEATVLTVAESLSTKFVTVTPRVVPAVSCVHSFGPSGRAPPVLV